MQWKERERERLWNWIASRDISLSEGAGPHSQGDTLLRDAVSWQCVCPCDMEKRLLYAYTMMVYVCPLRHNDDPGNTPKLRNTESL